MGLKEEKKEGSYKLKEMEQNIDDIWVLIS